MPAVETLGKVTEYLTARGIAVELPDPQNRETLKDWEARLHGDGLLLTSGATTQRYGLAIEFTERGGKLMVEVRHQPGSIQELEAIHRKLPAGSKGELFSIKNLANVVFDDLDRIVFKGGEENILGRKLRDITLYPSIGLYDEHTRFRATP